MADELHDVVKLLLARMESHPEEFGGSLMVQDSREDRWWSIVRDVREHGTKAEREALDAAMRKVKLHRAHEMMMDELCNGDERRRRQQEEDDYERTMLAQQQAAMNPSMGARLRATIAPALERIDQQTTYTWSKQNDG